MPFLNTLYYIYFFLTLFQFLKVEFEQKRRKKLIEKTCNFLKINRTVDDIPVSYLDHFIVDDTHKLIYCFVPKV